MEFLCPVKKGLIIACISSSLIDYFAPRRRSTTILKENIQKYELTQCYPQTGVSFNASNKSLIVHQDGDFVHSHQLFAQLNGVK